MRQFNCICWCYSTCNTSTKSEDEAAADELALAVSSGLDGGTDEHHNATNEDGKATTVTISEETAKRERSNLAELIHDENDAGRGTLA